MLSLGFVGYLTQGVYESSDVWYGLRAGSSLAMLAVLACSGWFKWFRIGTKTLMLATAAAIASAVVFAVDADGAFGWTVSLLGGTSSAVLMFSWMLLLSRYEKRVIALVAVIGLVLSGCIIMGVPHLDSALALIVAVGSAFATGAAALLLDADLRSCAPDGPLRPPELARIPWITVVMLLLSSFQATVLYGIATHLTWLYNWSPNYVAFGIAVLAVLGATLGALLKSQRWAHTVWIPQFLLVVVALAFACFSVRLSIQIAVGLLLAAVFCAHFLHWLVFPALFSSLRIPRAFLAGIVLICTNGALAAAFGDVIGDALPHSMQNLGGVAGISVIMLLMVFAATELAYRRAFGPVSLFPQPASPTVTGDGEGSAERLGGAGDALAYEGNASADDPVSTEAAVAAAPAADPLDILQSRIDDLAPKYGFTPREIEMAFLTAQGFSCGYIAEKLVVAESTVRFHQKNLYRKADVHSRNEFIEFVNELDE